MRRYGSAVLLLLVGGAVLRISLFSELYLRYVQPALRPYLVVSGALLMLLGVVAAVRGRGRGSTRRSTRSRTTVTGMRTAARASPGC